MRRRTTARWGRRPRTGQTPPGPARRPGPSTPAGGNGAAGSTPRAPTRSRCAGSGPPAPPCGSGFPASATPPAPAPARRYARPAAAVRAPAPRTRRRGSGGSSGPASPARCAPGCRTGRYGYRRRSRAPASHAAWLTAPHPAPGRSADSGTTRSPAPARGACAPPTTPEVLLSNRRPARNRCRAGALARITDHAAARQGRLVLRSLSPVATAIPVPAADHHWPRPPPAPASPRRATRPHRTGSGSRRSRSPPRPTRPATHNPSRPGSSRPPRQRPPHARNHDPNRLQPRACAAQPTPHRRRRHPQAGADPAMPSPVGTGGQRRPNPFRRIRSAQQHRHRQQHVRRPCTTRQRARRGRSGSLSPSIRRARAYPQPPSTPTPHVGQPIPPAASRDSTRTGSTSTVTIGASKHYSAAPRKPAKTSAGCRAPISSSSH